MKAILKESDRIMYISKEVNFLLGLSLSLRGQKAKSLLLKMEISDIELYGSNRYEQNEMVEPRKKINLTTKICESALNLSCSRVNCRCKTFIFFVQGAPNIKGISSRIH